MIKNINLPVVTLGVALLLSTIAAYYSIIGLTAIFAGAVIPVIIMGSMLEIAKITTTVWLRNYWDKCGWLLKAYLVPAVVTLALMTSIGIFGFLSKAHIDQGVPTGDIAAKVSLLDEKIKTQRENIQSARSAMVQMDAQVNSIMTKGDTENSAARSVLIRRQQAPERAKLQKEIEVANISIAKLNEERAPIASELRKVDAEVGPIKYIAAMIYGDDPDQNILEKAVRWMIILLVLVFDPLAIVLVLAANQSKEWEKEIAKKAIEQPNYEPDNGPLTDIQIDKIKESVDIPPLVTVKEPEPIVDHRPAIGDRNQHYKYDNYSYVNNGLVGELPEKKELPVEIEPDLIEQLVQVEKLLAEEKIDTSPTPVEPEKTAEITADIETENVTALKDKPYKDLAGDYVVYLGKHMHRNVLKEMRPDLFASPDAVKSSNSFGIKFPEKADKGDMFVRVDVLPNKVYKFDGKSWIAVVKENSDTYLHNNAYMNYLTDKIGKGEYDIESLTEPERIKLEEYLKNQNT